MQYRIKTLREQQKMTQEELAKRSGVSRATICGLENAEMTVAKTGTLIKLAEALGCRVSDIFLDE